MRPSGWRPPPGPVLIGFSLLSTALALATQVWELELGHPVLPLALPLWIPCLVLLAGVEGLRHAYHRSALWRCSEDAVEYVAGLRAPRVRRRASRFEVRPGFFAGLPPADQLVLTEAARREAAPARPVAYEGGTREALRYLAWLLALPILLQVFGWLHQRADAELVARQVAVDQVLAALPGELAGRARDELYRRGTPAAEVEGLSFQLLEGSGVSRGLRRFGGGSCAWQVRLGLHGSGAGARELGAEWGVVELRLRQAQEGLLPLGLPPLELSGSARPGSRAALELLRLGLEAAHVPCLELAPREGLGP